MGEKIVINGVELFLNDPDIIENMKWIGGDVYMSQLLAAWIIVDEKHDIPMNPQILGKPGVGKTTLAYSAAGIIGLPVYIFQCTVDTRPEDLLISPVIGENNTIQYHASSLVTAMIKGGVCILDEANRMSEKSWASLAALLDQRRYIESIIAGIKIKAHPDFRVCVTMNDDSSTFEVPEYIHSRLQPQIFIEFPEREEEIQILQFNLPFAQKELIEYTVKFLQNAHRMNKNYTVRDGINICRYYLKYDEYTKHNSLDKKENSKSSNLAQNNQKIKISKELFHLALRQVLGDEAIEFLYQNMLNSRKDGSESKFKNIFDKLNDSFFQNPDEKDFEDDFDDDGLSAGFSNEIDEDEEDLDDLDNEEFFFLDTDADPNFRDSNKNYRNKDSGDDVLHIFEKKNIDKDDQVDDDLGAFFKNLSESNEDPNDLIREFLDRKSREHKKDSSHGNSKNLSRKKTKKSSKKSK